MLQLQHTCCELQVILANANLHVTDPIYVCCLSVAAPISLRIMHCNMHQRHPFMKVHARLQLDLPCLALCLVPKAKQCHGAMAISALPGMAVTCALDMYPAI